MAATARPGPFIPAFQIVAAFDAAPVTGTEAAVE